MKSDVFKKELELIKDVKYREVLKKLLELLPDYFYEVPASSTGKYHPEFALNEGGLVRHTKVAVRIAYELLGNSSTNNFNDREKDLILMALVLHDSFKSGKEKSEYTRFDHPLIVGEFLDEKYQEVELSIEDKELIKDMIASHMGEWNTNTYSDVVLPKPESKYQRFVHMCDYLASRKFLNVEFVDNNIVD